MKTRHSELADKYSRMAAEEFELIKRGDLAEWAKPFYDIEKARRLPGWRYEEPPPAEKLHDVRLMQKRLERKQKLSMVAWGALLLCGYAFVLFAVPSNRNDIRGFMGLLLMLLTLNMAFSRTAIKTGYAIVWLRRFHRQQHRSFQKILEQACMFVGIPITVQDSSFRYSMTMANIKIGNLALPAVIVLVLLGLVPMTPVAVDLLMIITYLIFLMLIISSRKLGYTRLYQSTAEGRTLQLFTDVRAHKGSRGGVVILKCEDSFWRDVVSLAIQRADVVIVDVTEPSENVIWELHTAVGVKSPERILLAYEKDQEPFDLPPTISAKLQAAIGDIPLNRFALFTYPKKRRGVPWNIQSSWSSNLREILTKCVSHSSA
jgi:hypothetical protein